MLWFFFDSMIKMLALQSVQLVTSIDICKYKSAAQCIRFLILPAHVSFWTWFHFDTKRYIINQERLMMGDIVVCWLTHLLSFSQCVDWPLAESYLSFILGWGTYSHIASLQPGFQVCEIITGQPYFMGMSLTHFDSEWQC